MQRPPGVLYEKEEIKQPRERTRWVLLCNSGTERECLALKLFGSPKREWIKVSQVKKDDTLYLHNYETNRLHGVFEAIEDGKMNIEPYAFDGYFPAQVRVVRKLKAPSADKGALLPLIKKGWIRTSHKTGIMLFLWCLSPKLIDALFERPPASPQLLHQHSSTHLRPDDSRRRLRSQLRST